jgi:tRNA-dihydrouridine synthase A
MSSPSAFAKTARRPAVARGWRLSVAPMMDWTDRHCRHFHRLLTRHARLYTEMVTTGALLHGDVERHLRFDASQHPLALQLGGSEPDELAHCARLAQQWGYDEVNLNCGCPSPRVQRGAFGACLMAEPQRVRDCVAAMRAACDLPVTVKHRIGLDRQIDYAFVRDFVGTVAEAGVEVFIVHARAAWLDGLSPKDNRCVPPLDPDVVQRLACDFPDRRFILNGGIVGLEALKAALGDFDGAMVGRDAYHHPWQLSLWDDLIAGRAPGDMRASVTRERVEEAMLRYIDDERRRDPGLPTAAVTRHMLGLWHGQPGSRAWRQVMSDAALARGLAPAELFQAAAQARRRAAAHSAAEPAPAC